MMKRLLLFGLLLTATASPAIACPVCHTSTGVQVRRGIFNDDFAKNVLQTVAPFPVFALAIAGVRRALGNEPKRARRRE